MLAQQPQIALSGLGGKETSSQHLPGGIIDEGNQAALGRTLLEPVVVAAVDLYQFATATPARAWAVQALVAAPFGFP